MSFQRLLTQGPEDKFISDSGPKSSLKAIRELGRMFNDEEVEAIKPRSKDPNASGRSTPVPPTASRRFVGMDDASETNFWPPSHFGPSGRLPGVYQKYLLVRPYPSLRTIFTSAMLRIPGLLQPRFLDRISSPQHVREGLSEALAQGVGVTAKISWLTAVGANQNASTEGRPRWIHCTPMLGSDSKIGAWMVVIVEGTTQQALSIGAIRSKSTVAGNRIGRQVRGFREANLTQIV